MKISFGDLFGFQFQILEKTQVVKENNQKPLLLLYVVCQSFAYVHKKYPFEFVSKFVFSNLMYSYISSKNIQIHAETRHIFIASHLGGFRDERAG